MALSKKPLRIQISKILEILPHRYPFVMVDRVTEIIAGKSIRGHKCVAFNEPWFAGHFPNRPIMPGVLILEALAQIGGILAYASDPFDPASNLKFFLGIDKAKFRHTVTPGDRLDLHVTVLHHRSNVWKLKGEASVADVLQLAGGLTPEADRSNAMLTRIDASQHRIVVPVELSAGSRTEAVHLHRLGDEERTDEHEQQWRAERLERDLARCDAGHHRVAHAGQAQQFEALGAKHEVIEHQGAAEAMQRDRHLADLMSESGKP